MAYLARGFVAALFGALLVAVPAGAKPRSAPPAARTAQAGIAVTRTDLDVRLRLPNAWMVRTSFDNLRDEEGKHVDVSRLPKLMCRRELLVTSTADYSRAVENGDMVYAPQLTLDTQPLQREEAAHPLASLADPEFEAVMRLALLRSSDNWPNFRLDRSAPLLLGGERAVAFSCVDTLSGTGEQIRYRSIVLVHRGVFYIMEFSALDEEFDKNSPVFTRIAASLQFLTPPVPRPKQDAPRDATGTT